MNVADINTEIREHFQAEADILLRSVPAFQRTVWDDKMEVTVNRRLRGFLVYACSQCGSRTEGASICTPCFERIVATSEPFSLRKLVGSFWRALTRLPARSLGV